MRAYVRACVRACMRAYVRACVRVSVCPCACTYMLQNRWLALHGFLDNAATYDKLAPELLCLGASAVVALDFAGHGKSDWRYLQFILKGVCLWVCMSDQSNA